MSDEIAPGAEPEGTATPAPETAPEAPPAAETPPEDAAHRRRLIEAARIERRTRAERAAAEKARAEAQAQSRQIEQWQRERAEWEQQKQRWEQSRQNALRNPKALLEEVGLDLDTIVRAHLDEGPTPDVLVRDIEKRSKGEVDAVKQEIERLRAELAERDKKAQESEITKAVHALQTEIAEHLQSDPDKYELTIALDQQGEVFELMRLAYQQRGVELPVAKAAEMIEEYLLTQAKKTANAKKLASLFKPQESSAAPTQAGKPATQAKPSTDAREPKASATTLTSKLATSPAQPTADDDALLDKDVALDMIAKKIKATKEAKRSAK